jgi:hypothetical protein
VEAIRSSETSGTTLRTTRRHIPEEDTLHVFHMFVLWANHGDVHFDILVHYLCNSTYQWVWLGNVKFELAVFHMSRGRYVYTSQNLKTMWKRLH